jgi:hypothetical protein
VFLVLSSSRSRLISVLAAISSTWRVKILIISLSKAFTSPIAALPATVFYSIVVGVLDNFRVISLEVLVYACSIGPFLRVLFFFFRFYPYSPNNILKVLFYILVLFIVL